MTLCFHIFISECCLKNNFLVFLRFVCKPTLVVERWTCTLRFKSLPKVWRAVKIAGTTSSLRARVIMQSAANLVIWFNNSLLSQNKSQSSDGIVNVICCHSVLGKILFCLAIHVAVAFLPHEEHSLDLQVWGIIFMLSHLSLEHLYFL